MSESKSILKSYGTFKNLEKRPFFKIDFDSLMHLVSATKSKKLFIFGIFSRVLHTGDSGNLCPLFVKIL